MGEEKVTQLLEGVEPYFVTEDGSVGVYLGDSTETVPGLKPRSVHLIFTEDRLAEGRVGLVCRSRSALGIDPGPPLLGTT